MKTYGLKRVVILLGIFVLLSTVVSAIEWHDCCDVKIDDSKLELLYHDFVENNFCVQGYSYEECVANAIANGRSIDNFKQVLVETPKGICFEKTTDLKKEFNKGYTGLFGKTSFDEIGYFFSNVDFEDPTLKKIMISPTAYDVKKTLWKEPRNPKQSRYNFQMENSRFSYLKPKISLSEMMEIYADQYSSGLKICSNKNIGIYSDKFNSCMKENTHFSNEEIDSYYFYSDLKGSFFVEALTVCEEELGFQNDIGLVSFPGQSSFASCEQSLMVDGCCPGYHKDKTFSVCCSTGFEAYKSEDGSVLCGPARLDDEIVFVDISLDKTKLLLNGKDEIEATLTYYARTPLGETVPYANKNIFHGIVAESASNQFHFDVVKESPKTDEFGNLAVIISLKNANLNSLGLDNDHPAKVFVWSLDEPSNERKDVSFNLSYGAGLEIISLKQVSDALAWQGTPVQLRVHVDDPLNEKKMYIFSSKTGFRVDGKTEDFMVFKTTNSNDVEFSWMAPIVSKEMKMDYAKRIRNSLVKMSLVAGEDFLGSKLDGKLAKASEEGVELTSRFSKLNGVYDGMNKLVKVDIQSASAIQQGKLMAQTASEPYQVAKNGISYLMWLEGTIGLLGKPATPLLTSLKVGLTGIDDWYSAVEDLEKIAGAEKITLEFPVTVTVKGLQSNTNDTLTENIPVQGFEMVLGD